MAWSALEVLGLVTAAVLILALSARGIRGRGGAIALEGLFYLAGPTTTVIIGFYPLAAGPLQGLNSYVGRAILVLAAGLVIIRLIDGARKGAGAMALAVVLFYLALFASALAGAPGAGIPEPYWTTPLIVLAFVLDPHMTFDRLIVVATRAIRIVAVVSAVVAVALPNLAFESLDPRTIAGIHRLQGITQQPNGLGALVAIGLLLELYRRKWLWAALMVIELLLTQSHTAWIAASTAIVVILATRNPDIGRISSALIAGVLIYFALFPSVATNLLADLSGDDSLTLTGRTNIWAAAMHGFYEYPVFGYGPNLLGDDYRARWLPNAPFAAQAHDQWVQTLAGQGVVGATTLIILLGTAAYYAWQSRRATRWYGLVLLLVFVARCVTETPLRPVGADFTTIIEVLVLCLPLYAVHKPRGLDVPVGRVGDEHRARFDAGLGDGAAVQGRT